MLGIGCPDRHALPRVTSIKCTDRELRSPPARAGSFTGATLPPERVPVKDCFAPIAVARRRTRDFPILILRLPAVRIFCRAHVDRERRAAPAGAHARVRELATTRAMEPERGLVLEQFCLRCPTRMKSFWKFSKKLLGSAVANSVGSCRLEPWRIIALLSVLLGAPVVVRPAGRTE